jgi:hypothetical protein
MVKNKPSFSENPLAQPRNISLSLGMVSEASLSQVVEYTKAIFDNQTSIIFYL